MKIKLVIRKKGIVLYDGVHEIADAESFGGAFASVWAHLEDRRACRRAPALVNSWR